MSEMFDCPNDLILRQRAIVVSIYLEYLLDVLSCASGMSVTKALVLMFLSKSIEAHGTRLLNGRYSKQLLERATCAVSGDFDLFLYELEYSIEAIEIAANAGLVAIEDAMVSLTSNGRSQDNKMNNLFLTHLIDEVVSLDDGYVLLEMIRNV